MIRAFLLLPMALFSATLFACSCFGPQTFCGTLDPPYEEPQWWIPDAIILGVKTAQADHGMDMEVVETLSGEPVPGEILRVWGDCGLLCRIYPSAWEIGDTVVWALKYTDLSGNGSCGTSLEQEGDYMISICGTYVLSYENGIVSGPIAEGVNAMPFDDLGTFITSCLAMAVKNRSEEPAIEVFITDGTLIAELKGPKSGTMRHQLLDAQGKLVAEGTTQGDRARIPISDHATGIHFLRISSGRHNKTLRVPIP